MPRRTSNGLFLVILIVLQTFAPASFFSYSYNDLNRLTHLSIGALSDPTNAVSAFTSHTAAPTYTLNNSCHRTAMTSTLANWQTDTLANSYTYDKVGNRLTRATTGALLRSILPRPGPVV